MKICPEMDKEIVKLLDMEGMPLSVYAARCIEKLQAENAELRARLEKAEELPCKVGDTVYLICDVGARKVIRKYKVDGFMYDGEIGWRISIEIACPQISLIGDRIFFTRAEAEARIKELQGGER